MQALSQLADSPRTVRELAMLFLRKSTDIERCSRDIDAHVQCRLLGTDHRLSPPCRYGLVRPQRLFGLVRIDQAGILLFDGLERPRVVRSPARHARLLVAMGTRSHFSFTGFTTHSRLYKRHVTAIIEALRKRPAAEVRPLLQEVITEKRRTDENRLTERK